MIRMTWKIKSLIFLLVLLCVPAAAIALNGGATTHSGGVSVTSKATSQATINSGDIFMTSKSTTEAIVTQGNIYTIFLNEDPSTDYKWTVAYSRGLKLMSDTLGSEGNRELKFLADQKGKQTIKADYSKSGDENLKLTSEFVLDVV
jgi:inhibitor of cysteine peptidase